MLRSKCRGELGGGSYHMFCCESGMQSNGMPCKLNLTRGNEEVNGMGSLLSEACSLNVLVLPLLNSRVE